MNKEYLLIALISATITAGITLIGQIIVTLINRKYEDKKHRREILMKSAIDATKLNYQRAELFRSKQSTDVYPLEVHAVRMHKLCELMERNDIAPDELRKGIKDILLASDIAGDAGYQYEEKAKTLPE